MPQMVYSETLKMIFYFHHTYNITHTHLKPPKTTTKPQINFILSKKISIQSWTEREREANLIFAVKQLTSNTQVISIVIVCVCVVRKYTHLHMRFILTRQI